METMSVNNQISKLEGRLRLLYFLLAGGILCLITLAFSFINKKDSIIKARSVIIEDENGKEIIILGAPVPDPKGYSKRMNPSTGIVINDPNGFERFGVGLDNKGNVIMGFDSPPDKGDPRNPERINIVADSEGRGTIRFLNQKTEVVSFLRLDENDEFCLEFIDWKDGKIMRRQIRYHGEDFKEWE